VRAFGYYAGGSHPRRMSIGGSWGLRGYPFYGRVSGTRAALLSQELRFPIAQFLSIGFPFGEFRLPALQGALFADLGGAWSDRTSQRGLLGSAGVGFRLPIIQALVLRLDVGRRFEFGDVSGYGLHSPESGRSFVDFFFGFNY